MLATRVVGGGLSRKKYSSPMPRNRPWAPLESNLALIGFDLPQTSARPGQSVPVTLYWEAVAPVTRNLRVFVHFIGADGKLWGLSDDLRPGGFEMPPTSRWPVFRYKMDAPPAMLDPAHRLGVPHRPSWLLWDGFTGERMRVLDANGQVADQDGIVLSVASRWSREQGIQIFSSLGPGPKLRWRMAQASGVVKNPAVAGPWAKATLALMIVVLVHSGLGVAFGLVTPIFEIPDEANHFLFVRYLQLQHALPVQTLDQDGPRAHHPPLYFLLGALVSAGVPDAGPADRVEPPQNPNIWFRYGDRANDHKEKFIHSAAEDWPFRGQALAVHLIRLLSTLFSALAVVFTFLAARELLPAHPVVALLAAVVLAFNPDGALHERCGSKQYVGPSL